MTAQTWSRYIIIALTTLVIGVVVYHFSTIISYVITAWVLSLVGQPIYKRIRLMKIGKLRPGPGVASILTILCFFLVFGGLVAMFVPSILKQASNLASVDYQAIATALEEPYHKVGLWLAQYGIKLPEDTLEQLLKNSLKGWFEPSKIGNFIASVFGAIGSIIVNVASVVFITFFFLQERKLFINFILALVPEKYEQPTLETIKDTVALLTRYFGGLIIQLTIFGVALWLLLTILGIRNALLIALFGALMNVIPYIGPIIGAAFGIFITISSNLGIDFYAELAPMLIKVFVVFQVVQIIDNNLIQPYIFSKSVLAHPLEIFIMILVGAQVAGILGIILAIPVYTIIRVIAKEFLYQFKIVKQLTGRMEEEGY
ncbi:MAG TPA: AI-2E family transporter [Haliscomenobacter sp.]|uniref:AI-2E family transporter n=1 Tax=Haliscomenobacter sp. TaxID=2717303 RepID=UPI001DBDB419|nr:AI-2E family transporter [Haliscomenobacter sp.]MBK9490606.1 AI-2E family transporter [Haliscomenobacter sp.]HOY17186.1 AI-2E family transporter [Haliscomenobacter sp.]